MKELLLLFELQKELDALIAEKRGVTYQQTSAKRFLAFLVELGELANATRTFKYWSGKNADPIERLLDEYADGLHFLLSLGIANNITLNSFEVIVREDLLSDSFINVYLTASDFYRNSNYQNYQNLFNDFIVLGTKNLGFSYQQIIAAYMYKHKINYLRQEQNY